jgi:hypothetical protein
LELENENPGAKASGFLVFWGDSTWRPLHWASAQDVNVQVLHALAAVGALIGHQAKTAGAVLRAECRGDF